MDEQNTRDEAHLLGKGNNFLGLLWRARPQNTAHHDSKARILVKPLQPLLKVAQNFLGCVIALDSVNRDLHLLKSRFVQGLDQIRSQKKPIGNHARAEKTKFTALTDQMRKVRVKRWLTARQGNPECAETFQLPQALLQNTGWNRFTGFVELRAVAAR